MMEAKKKKSGSLLSTILHVLHACVSIGLVIAVVRNQLVNESRFTKLERNDCKCPIEPGKQREQASNSFDPIPGNTNNETKVKFDSTIPSLVKRTLEKLEYRSQEQHMFNYTGIKGSGSVNKSQSRNTNLKETEESHAETTLGSTVNSTDIKILNAASNEGNTTKQSKQNSPSEYEKILKTLSNDKLELFSCLDKLKVIFENQITAGKTNKKDKKGCKLLQGDPGEKGERGEKGAIGPKGCPGTFMVPPVIHSSPQYLVFNEGDPAVLLCNTTAIPSAQITWYRNNVKLPGERGNTSYRHTVSSREIRPEMAFVRSQTCPNQIPHGVSQSTLVIKQSRGSDSGKYICKAHNMMGAATYEIQILVQEHVRCSAVPSSATVVQGADVQLSCQASGVPNPTVTWHRKDGGPMPTQYNATGQYLHIYQISKEEEGTFVCLATNILGSKKTEATITVNVFPKITSFLNQRITINESQTLVLPCNASGYPSPKIRWSKTNDSLPDDRHVYNSQELKLRHIEYEDGGEYVCTANNTIGSVFKKTTVIVQVGPKITQRPNTTEYGYRGKSKILWLDVFAFPAAKVTWTLPNNKEIDQGRFQQRNGSLLIKDIKYTDSGRYQATARNFLGQVKLTSFLVIRDAVPATIRSVQVTATLSIIEGKNLTKTCHAVGIPTPEIVWRHNTTLMTSAKALSLSLNIVNIGNQHAGQYTCTATNQFGFEQQHFTVKIIPRWIRVQKSYYDYYSKNTNRTSGELKSRYFSRGQNYPNRLNQYWKLTSNTKIGLYFKVFSTESCCDKVRIYDGSSTSSPLLAEFSGNTLPPNIKSSSNQLYITFTTDDSKPYRGFLATYKAID